MALCGGEEDFAEYSKVYHATEHCRAAAEAWALLKEQQNTGDTYVYCLDRQLPGDDMGPFHAADLWYVFKTFMRGWRPWTGVDYELAYACNTYWANFAKTGVPQGDRLPEWTPYTAASQKTMQLGERIGMMAQPDNARVNFRRDFLLKDPTR